MNLFLIWGICEKKLSRIVVMTMKSVKVKWIKILSKFQSNPILIQGRWSSYRLSLAPRFGIIKTVLGFTFLWPRCVESIHWICVSGRQFLQFELQFNFSRLKNSCDANCWIQPSRNLHETQLYQNILTYIAEQWILV